MDPETSFTLSKASRNTLITTSVIGEHNHPCLQAQMRNPDTDRKILTYTRRYFCHCTSGICPLPASQRRYICTDHSCPITAVQHSSTHTYANEGKVLEAPNLP